LLYVPTGNAAPDFDRSLRPGTNLYTGSVVALDARSGQFRRVYPIVPGDFHDWDVSAAPAVITTKGGRRMLAAAPKDGYLHAFDLADGKKLYETAITRLENHEVPFSEHRVHFCPGSQGGTEWNGPAYDPDSNLIFTGSIEWCTTIALVPSDSTRAVAEGKPWTGNKYLNPKHVYGDPDPKSSWAGWIYATEADTGRTVWKYKTPDPVASGITATAGGLVFAGDLGGTLYAFDARSGQKLWSAKVGGAIGGGVITYTQGGAQRIAVAAGMTSPVWPTEKTTGKVVVLGLTP
jgi:alcohol dehydrogenase (cytochrome c)